MRARRRTGLGLAALAIATGLAASCGGDHADDDDILVESADLAAAGGGDGCTVSGTVFNDGESRCRVLIDFVGLDADGNEIARAQQNLPALDGNAREPYVAQVVDPGGAPIDCTAIDDLEIEDVDADC